MQPVYRQSLPFFSNILCVKFLSIFWKNRKRESALGGLCAVGGSIEAVLESGAELRGRARADIGAGRVGASAGLGCKLPVQTLLVATITCRHMQS